MIKGRMNRTNVKKRRFIFAMSYFIPVAGVIMFLSIFSLARDYKNLEIFNVHFDSETAIDGTIIFDQIIPYVDDRLPGASGSEYGDFDTDLIGTENFAESFTMSDKEFIEILENSDVDLPNVLQEKDFLEIEKEILQDSIIRTLIISILLISISGIFAYWLSGKFIRPLEEALEKQKRFVSDAAHEIRTPLTLIKTEFDILEIKDNKSERDYVVAINKVQDSIGYLSQLVSRLFYMAQLEAGGAVDKNTSMIYLSAYTRETVDKLLKKCKEKNISISFEDDEGAQAQINSNEYIQLLIILLDNAVKYTPSNGEIKVFLRHAQKKTELCISDSGCGIDQGHREKVFDRLYRIDQSRGSKKSLGLGLSIARHIVNNANGTISVDESELGGAAFHITFPRNN